MDLRSQQQQQQRGWMEENPKPQHPQVRGALTWGDFQDMPRTGFANGAFRHFRTYLGLHNSNTVVSGFETALEIEEGNKSLQCGVTLPIPPVSES